MATLHYIDLFGNVVDVPLKSKWGNPNGYPANPGSGPAGETCATCEFKIKVRGGRKAYWKCLKFHSPNTEHQWSGCISSDIRLKSPACKFWEPELSKTPMKYIHPLRERNPFEIKELK